MLATLLLVCHFADLLSGDSPQTKIYRKILQCKIHSNFYCGRYSGNLLECHADIQAVLDLHPVLFCQMLIALLLVCHFADLLSGDSPQTKIYRKILQCKIHSNFYCGRYFENLLQISSASETVHLFRFCLDIMPTQRYTQYEN